MSGWPAGASPGADKPREAPLPAQVPGSPPSGSRRRPGTSRPRAASAGPLSPDAFDTTGDATLIINTASGEWVCGDDSFETLNPTVDFEDPEDGRYDVWIGSFEDGEQIDGELHVTELASNHP